MTEYTKYKLNEPVDKILNAFELLSDTGFMQLKIIKGNHKACIDFIAYKFALDNLEDAIKQLKKLGGDDNEQ